MAEAVYILCALTSLACAGLLLRAYRRNGGPRFLLWGGLCFLALAANNVILFIDKVVLPDVDQVLHVDFAVWRAGSALLGLLLLLYGLIWDAE
jgi:hypothetical protein